MDTSIHVIQPFAPRPVVPDRRRRDRDTPAFDLNAPPEGAPGAKEGTEGSSSGERPAANEAEPTLAHEEGLGERVDVIA